MAQFESSIKQIPYPQQNVYNMLSDLSNSGRVSGDVVGGIVGTTFSLAQGASNLVSTCSNTGKVLSYVKKSFSLAGGIVGVAQATTISNNFNSGLVEVSSDQLCAPAGLALPILAYQVPVAFS